MRPDREEMRPEVGHIKKQTEDKLDKNSTQISFKHLHIDNNLPCVIE